jgi:osmotically-inducible protein OsmY
MMNSKKPLLIGILSVLLSFTSLSAQARDNNQDNENLAVNSQNSDNTEVNMRDRNAAESTADQAENNLSDRQVMQKIRHEIVADNSLSRYAHNIKVIAQNGKVTLKGPVRNNAEHDKILDMAADVVGEDNVTDKISIKPKKRGS